MKQLFLFAFFCICFFSFASGTTRVLTGAKDTLRVEGNPVLKLEGTNVYKDGNLLSKREVLKILSPFPELASQYQKGKSLRTSGVLMILGGIGAMTGGVVLMISGIETNNSSSGYSSNPYVSYNDNYYLGIGVLTIGELLLDGGIACSIIGKIKVRRSINNYNKTAGTAFINKSESINYQFGLLDNGNVGLKLTF